MGCGCQTQVQDALGSGGWSWGWGRDGLLAGSHVSPTVLEHGTSKFRRGLPT